MGLDAITAHAGECAECRSGAPLAIAALGRGALPLDVARLSALALRSARPALARRARIAYWRHLATALGVALLPLPLVVIADLWALGSLYALASAWLPAVVATYLVASYGATILVLIGSVYAIIPLLLARRLPARAAIA